MNFLMVNIYGGISVTGTPLSESTTADPNDTTGSYSVTLSTLPDGVYTLQTTQADSAGNLGLSAPVTFTVDTAPPTVTSITPATVSSPTNSSVIVYNVLFNEPVTGVSSSFFTVTGSGLSGASVTSESGSGAAYTVTVGTGTGDGTLALNMNNSVAIDDLAGNAIGSSGGSYYASSATITVDRTAPTVSSIARTSGSSTSSDNSVSFTVTFDEAVSGVDVGDFTPVMGTGISGAAVSSVMGSGTTYTVSVDTGTGGSGGIHDTLGLALAGSPSISDLAGNALTSTTPGSTQSYTIDKSSSSFVSITRNDSVLTNSTSVHYAVTFTSSVSITSSDFTVATAGLSGASVTAVSGSGASYTVTVNTGTGDGFLELNLTSIGGSSVTPVLGQIYAVSKTPPAVSIDDPSSGDQTTDSTPTITGIADPDASMTVKVYSGTNTSGTLMTTMYPTADDFGFFTATVSSALAQGTYTVTASETDGAGNTGTSDPVTFQVALAAPAAPSGLTASAVSSSEIDLSWTAASSSDCVSGYTIEISTDNGQTFTTLATLTDGAATSFQAMLLKPLSPYVFKVFAFNEAGSSTASTTPVTWTQDGLAAPTNVHAVGDGLNGIHITWDYTGTDVSNFAIQAKWQGTNFETLATVSSSARDYLYADYSTEKMTFRVIALGIGESAPSADAICAVDTSFMGIGATTGLTVTFPDFPSYAHFAWTQSGSPVSVEILVRKIGNVTGPHQWYDAADYSYSFWDSGPGPVGSTIWVNLDVGMLYYPTGSQVAIRTTDSLGVKSISNLVTLDAPDATPAPSDLTGSISGGNVEYSWTPTGADDGGYGPPPEDILYDLNSRGFNSRGWLQDATTTLLIQPDVSYSSIEVEGEVEGGLPVSGYSYLTAFDAEGNAGISNNILDLATRAAPSSLSAKALNGTSIGLSWLDNSFDETGFIIQREYDDTTWANYATVPSDDTSFVDSGLTPGETYHYRIIAKGSTTGFNSSPSGDFSFTMPATSCITCAGNPFNSADGQSAGTSQTQSAGTTPSGSLVVALSRATGNAVAFDSNGNSNSSVQDLKAAQLHNGTVVITAGGGFRIYFANSSGTYSGIGGNPYFLNAVTDGGHDYLVLTDGTGTLFYFNAFTETHPGALHKEVYPNGLTRNVDFSNSNGDPTQITEELADGDTNVYSYSYNMDGTRSSVSLAPATTSGSLGTIQTTDYTYSGGNLQRITVTTYSGATAGTEVSFMRYYGSDDPNGPEGGLKYLVTGSNYESLLAYEKTLHPTFDWTDSGVTSAHLDAIPDSDLALYADNAYQYDSAGRVTSIVNGGNGCSACTGGFGTTQFAYYTKSWSSVPDVYNTWTTRQTQLVTGYDTLNPDNPKNSEIITYSNAYGQVMLQVNLDVATGQRTMDYYRYDPDTGQEILHANPSAVTGYDESLKDLVGLQTSGDYTYLSDSSGLIEYTDYYTTSASLGTVGGAAGFVEDTAISQGDGGPVPTGGAVVKHYQSFTDYIGQDDGGPTVYFVADQTSFANDLTVQPVSATSTELTNADARTTQFSYTWFSGSNQVASTTITLPTATSGENGPGAADVSVTVNDTLGRPVWTKDADGYITYTAYDYLTGAVIQSVQDVNTSDLPTLDNYSGTFSGGYNTTTGVPELPSGWTTPTGGGLNLMTTYQVDNQGRTVEMTDPKGNHTFTVYDDANHATFSFVGTESLSGGNGTVTATGPIQMTRTRLDYTYDTTLHGTYDESITLSTSSTLTVTAFQIVPPTFLGSGDNTNLLDLTGSGSPQFVIQSLSRTLYNTAGQMIESDAYSGITNAGYLATSSGSPYSSGTGVSFDATKFGYDARGQQALTISPTGTITVNTYDYLGRALGAYVGTDVTPSSNLNGYGTTPDWEDFIFGVNANPTTIPAGTNMTLISLNQYDGGGAGDSNLTQTTAYPNGSTAPRVTQYLYDWRDRQIATKTGVQTTETGNTSFISVTTLDNLGEATASYTFAADGIPLSDFASGVTVSTVSGHIVASVDASAVRAYSTASYDEQGRGYQSSTYSVDPATGYISSSSIVSNTWFDHRGNVIESQTSGGPASKMAYDGAGRVTASYTTDGGAANNSGVPLTGWSDAGSVANDVVLEQVEYTYDADGNVLMTTSRQRFHDNSDGDMGALGDPSSGIAARVSYTLSYYDALNRTIATVNVGTNGGVTDDSEGGLDLATDSGSDGIPDVLQGSVPTRSDTVLVTSYTYNAAGEVDVVKDPLGIESKTYYDALGRTLFTVAAWDGSYDPTTSALPSSGSANQTIRYTYDGAGHTLTMTAILPSGQHSQTTQYVYGVTTGGGSTINSNDLLQKVEYPDPSTGDASASSSAQNSFTYNALGQLLTKTDQNGTIHTYAYDVLGRIISDSAVSDALQHSATYLGTSGNDSITVSRTTMNGNTLRVTDGTTTLDLTLSALNSLVIDSGTGNDTVTIDASNGNINLPDGLYFRSSSGNNTLVIAGGSFTLTDDIGLDATNISVHLTDSATVTFLASEHLAALSLDSGTVATLAFGDDKILNVGSLSIAGATDAWTATLDLNDNAMIIRNTGTSATDQATAQRTTNQIKSGRYDNGANDWHGTGIRSTTAISYNTASGAELYALGILQNNYNAEGTSDGTVDDATADSEEYATFATEAVTLNDTLVMFTYQGDANLDGKVSSLDTTLYNGGGGLSGWVNGDFDYNGTHNSSDGSLKSYANSHQATQIILLDPTSGDRHLLTITRRIETAYNDQGQVDTVTSYDESTGGSVLNQVQRIYNGLGQLTAEYQEHQGEVDSGSTLNVGYSYDTLTHGSRLTGMTYPDGTILHYDYGTSGGLNDVLSRLESLIKGSTTVEGYAYLGLSTVVIRSHPEDGIDLSYVEQTGDTNAITDGGDQYTGFDRFGRVIDQNWIDTNNSNASVDRYQYTYDRDSNITAKANLLHSAFSEGYTYDDLNRLIDTTRNGSAYQSWDLDGVGNMNSVTDANGEVDRTHNDQNQLTAVGSNTLTFDNNGNTTTDDQGHTLFYDAWNRLIEVNDGDTVLAAYSYDGLGRRITESAPDSNPTQVYFSAQWQVVEEDIDTGTLALHSQYVWSLVYVNAMVLRDSDFTGDGGFSASERDFALQDATGIIRNVHLDVRRQTAQFEHDGTRPTDATWANLEQLKLLPMESDESEPA